MKLHQFIFIILLSLLGLQFVIGQEKPKAILFDEIGIVDCCPPNFDMFYIELIQTNADGIVVIYRNKNNPLESYNFENVVKSIFVMKSYGRQNEVNIQIVQGKSGDSTSAQFWKIPKGADIPNLETEKWNYSLPHFDKAFIIYQEDDVDGICPSFYEKENLLKILQTNNTLNLNVVIYTKTTKTYRQQVNEIKQFIGKNGNIKINRIQFYSRPKTDYKNAEYWLVPKRKKE